MRRSVKLENAFGDIYDGVEHPGRSDEPATITVGATTWYTTTWRREGWATIWIGDWEL